MPATRSTTKTMTTMARPSAAALLFLLLTIASLSSVNAQQESSRSIDPLNGSTLPTNFFTPANTFTPITTFSRAQGGNPTVLSGVGPSVAPGTAVFSYTLPTASVAPVPNEALSQSLASGGYVTASDARNLAPNEQNLQIADSAIRAGSSLAALGASALVGALLVLAF